MKLQFNKKGETIFKEGEMGYVFYIIISGSVAITINKPDPENPGQFKT